MGKKMEQYPVEHYIDRLEQSSDRLWETVALLDEDEVESAQLSAELAAWTPKAVVAHVGFWDDFHIRRIVAAQQNDPQSDEFPRARLDNDQQAVEDNARGWEAIVEETNAARTRAIDFARRLPEGQLHEKLQVGTSLLSPADVLLHLEMHTLDHVREIRTYCGSMQRWNQESLRAFVVEQYGNLMDSIGGWREERLLTEPVCGTWCARDVLAHVLSWNEYAYVVMHAWPDATPEDVQEWAWREGDTMSALNERLLQARADLGMIDIADGLVTYYRRTLRYIDNCSDEELARMGEFWGGTGSLSALVYETYLHATEHAEQLWRNHPATIAGAA